MPVEPTLLSDNAVEILVLDMATEVDATVVGDIDDDDVGNVAVLSMEGNQASGRASSYLIVVRTHLIAVALHEIAGVPSITLILLIAIGSPSPWADDQAEILNAARLPSVVTADAELCSRNM